MQLKDAWADIQVRLDEAEKKQEIINAALNDKIWLQEVEEKVHMAGTKSKNTIFIEISKKLKVEESKAKADKKDPPKPKIDETQELLGNLDVFSQSGSSGNSGSSGGKMI